MMTWRESACVVPHCPPTILGQPYGAHSATDAYRAIALRRCRVLQSDAAN